MAGNPEELVFELKVTGPQHALGKLLATPVAASQVVATLSTMETQTAQAQFGSPYRPTDISPFSPSSAIYFMDGWSDATFRLRGSGEEIHLEFTDTNTSIASSKPVLYDSEVLRGGLYLPVPAPLDPIAYLPKDTPGRYLRNTTMHLMQVISMNMRDASTGAKLLIGLPYAEQFPNIFFNKRLFPEGVTPGASYGVVQSLTEFDDPVTKSREVHSNGYPARSFFAIYHILQTNVGTFFNKKATQMELQPNNDGRLALKLPPFPFNYSLINGPIPLFDVKDPEGDPVGELHSAHHREQGAPAVASVDAWPYHLADHANLLAIKTRLA